MTKPAPYTPQRGSHRRLADFEGAVVEDGATLRSLIPVFGLLRCRVRVQLTSGTGTWQLRFVKPNADGTFPADGSGLHTTGNESDIAVSDTAEDLFEVTDLYGEGYLELAFVDDGVGGDGAVINHATFSAL